MNQRPTTFLAWICLVLSALACFLPWARLSVPNPIDVAKGIFVEDKREEGVLNAYILMRASEREAAIEDLAKGISAYQMIVSTADPPETLVETALFDNLSGAPSRPWYIYLIPLGPVLALLAAFGVLMQWPSNSFMFGVGAGMLILYVALRYLLDVSYPTRMVHGVEFSYGLWIYAYCMFLGGVNVTLRQILQNTSI